MSRRRRRYARGTTLVELMIVVVILGILAGLAGVGYKRYVARSRLAEAYAMLAELAAKEQLYFMETGMYVPARAGDTGNPPVLPSPDEAAAAYIPTNPTAADFESARTAHPIPSPMPLGWGRIGLKPQWPALYCSYMVNAGKANDPPPSGGIGAQLWSATPAVPWFYAVAACNLNTSDDTTAPSGLPSNASFLVLTYDSPAIRTLNEGH